jgi:hypothetical protein
MDAAQLASTYQARSDEELTQVVVANYDLTHAILAAHAEIAQDAGFELFDAAWAKRYWRSIVTDITGIKVVDEIYSWAIGASIAEAANLVVATYALPPVALPAAVALAVILVRAATRSRQAKPGP